MKLANTWGLIIALVEGSILLALLAIAIAAHQKEFNFELADLVYIILLYPIILIAFDKIFKREKYLASVEGTVAGLGMTFLMVIFMRRWGAIGILMGLPFFYIFLLFFYKVNKFIFFQRPPKEKTQ